MCTAGRAAAGSRLSATDRAVAGRPGVRRPGGGSTVAGSRPAVSTTVHRYRALCLSWLCGGEGRATRGRCAKGGGRTYIQSPPPGTKKKYKVQSPFLAACSTGLCDIAMLLVNYRIDADHKDSEGRVRLQLATNCSGPRGTFPEWLSANAKDSDGLPVKMTCGKGREKANESTGAFGKFWREKTTTCSVRMGRKEMHGQGGQGST